jgi:pyruvate decarboxylase
MEPGMDPDIYIGMAAPIRKTYTKLTDEKTMAAEIDRVIEEGVKSKLPVYIYVPMDVVAVQLDSTRLETPLKTSIISQNSQVEDEVVRSILELIQKSSNPAILADVLAIRHGGQELTRRLVNATNFPNYSTPLSKGVIQETGPNYNGVYNGSGMGNLSLMNGTPLNRTIVSFPGCAESLESSDLVLNIGPLLSDSNTGGFTRNIPDNKLVMLAHDHIQIHDKNFEGLHFLPVLKRIVEELEKQPAQYSLPRSQSQARIEVAYNLLVALKTTLTRNRLLC